MLSAMLVSAVPTGSSEIRGSFGEIRIGNSAASLLLSGGRRVWVFPRPSWEISSAAFVFPAIVAGNLFGRRGHVRWGRPFFFRP
jgi:hypothetical protein